MIPNQGPGPEANPLPVAPEGADYYYEQDNNGEVYAVFPSVPVFDEHEGRDGTVYDRDLLSKIAQNCNLRTADTGDKCPIVGWHTPEDKDPHKMPPVIGWAEGFRVEDFGRSDTRACIFSKFRVFADQLKYFLRHPRRSVEIWKGKNPEDRFFDPIAVLGAETPKRDLGLIYSKSDNGDESEHYSMPAFPGGGNTMVPGGAKPKESPKGPEEYDMDNNPESQTPNEMRLSKDSIGQIIEALKPTIQDMVQQEMVSKSEEPKMEDELKGKEDEAVEEVEANEAPAEEKEEAPEAPAPEAPAEEEAPEEEKEEDDDEKDKNSADVEGKEDYALPAAIPAIANAVGAAAAMGGGEQNAEDEEDKEVEKKDDTDEEEDNGLDHLIAELKKGKGEPKEEPKDVRKSGEEAEQNAKCDCEDDSMLGRYLAKEEEVDKHAMELGKRIMSGMKDKYGEDYEAMAGYMRSLEETDRFALAQYGGCKSCSQEDYALYEKLAGCGKKESYAAEASEEAAVERFQREAGEQQEKYAALERESQERYEALERESAEKYAALERESQERYSELNERYSRAMDEITELKSDVTEARHAERYSKVEKEISALASDGYVVDVEKEVKYCMTLTEEQYSEHVGERIPEMYRRAPIGPIIPVESSPELKVNTGENLSEKYARSAKEVVLNDRSKSFKEVLDWMVANDSTEFPSV